MNNTNYIKPELLILIPVLNMIGALIKTSQIKNKHIPFLITFIAIAFCMMYSWIEQEENSIPQFLFDNVVQGILISSMSVYNHQLFKQTRKKDN